MSDLLTGQDFLDGQLHLLPVHGVRDLSDGQDQGGNVPINTENKIIFKNYKRAGQNDFNVGNIHGFALIKIMKLPMHLIFLYETWT
jgi:hypothetical protein